MACIISQHPQPWAVWGGSNHRTREKPPIASHCSESGVPAKIGIVNVDLDLDLDIDVDVDSIDYFRLYRVGMEYFHEYNRAFLI